MPENPVNQEQDGKPEIIAAQLVVILRQTVKGRQVLLVGSRVMRAAVSVFVDDISIDVFQILFKKTSRFTEIVLVDHQTHIVFKKQSSMLIAISQNLRFSVMRDL